MLSHLEFIFIFTEEITNVGIYKKLSFVSAF